MEEEIKVIEVLKEEEEVKKEEALLQNLQLLKLILLK